MKISIIAIIGAVAATASFAGGKDDAPGQGTNVNWGQLTSSTIAGGFDQGGHSSDPSGDGHGPGTVDEPRVGLANVVAKGNLGATTDLIESLLP